jgi:hypothetical protein
MHREAGKMKSLRPSVAVVACWAALVAGCDSGAQAISAVTQGGPAVEGREVTLRGSVVQTINIPLVDAKAYRLKDATGDIVVWTTGPLPGEGEEVVVRGRVESVAIVTGQSFGRSLKEIDRRPPGIRWPWQ